MLTQTYFLDQLGWSAFYSRQLTSDDLTGGYPARVSHTHRTCFTVIAEHGCLDVMTPRDLTGITIGDWLLIEQDAPRVLRRLERKSLITRRAAGPEERLQPIAANIDTLFVMTSCNQDFNPSRLERYLVLARDAGVVPVIVLTKADLCDTTEEFVSNARTVANSAAVLALNAKTTAAANALGPWLLRGQTVAFVGSSGVGKSTLINTLVGNDAQSTAPIREDDSKGRHTTTARQMLALPSGAWVIDTPGMREIKLGAVQSGISAVFSDIEQLARSCRFRDCSHRTDAGCALKAAVSAGRLDARRLRSYLKLQREAVHAALALHEQREIDRRFGRARHVAERERLKRRR
jgi:ribosome biogenesis GTPase